VKLRGRVAIVTGGSRGIGRNIALAYAREGAAVVVSARSIGELDATEKEMRKMGVHALAVRADVSAYTDVVNLVKKAVEEFSRVDILVNNAGIAGPIGPLSQADPDKWVRTIMVNLVGAFHCCRAVLPYMLARQKGKIINISGGGSVSPRPNLSAYGASKAALVRLTETLAMELAPHNIQVNTMAPGGSPTKIVEEIAEHAAAAGDKEAGQAQAILRGAGVDAKRQAALAVFLASDDSDGLTGRMLHVNDDWISLIGRIDSVMATDLYTVKRVQPTQS
jgi:NAD(P)-dependent dehydrogenase (short-subunit alcohol dehydrogenase family)